MLRLSRSRTSSMGNRLAHTGTARAGRTWSSFRHTRCRIVQAPHPERRTLSSCMQISASLEECQLGDSCHRRGSRRGLGYGCYVLGPAVEGEGDFHLRPHAEASDTRGELARRPKMRAAATTDCAASCWGQVLEFVLVEPPVSPRIGHDSGRCLWLEKLAPQLDLVLN